MITDHNNSAGKEGLVAPFSPSIFTRFVLFHSE